MKEELLVTWEDVLECDVPGTYAIYLNELSNIPLLSQSDMDELFVAYHNGDESAKEKLILGNLKLVLFFAKRFKKKLQHLSYLDLVQEGNIGLIRSIEEYKVGDSAFSTYAAVSILRAITNVIDSLDSEIKRPVYLSALLRQYHSIICECQKVLKPIPSDQEICKKLNINSTMLKRVKESYNIYTISLNQLIDFSDSEIELETFISIPDENYRVFSDSIDDKRLLAVLKEELSMFEFYVIYYRFFVPEPLTMLEVSKKFHVSGERIRQIEQRALNKIKKYFSNDKIKLNHAYKKIIKKYGNQIDELKISPVEPDDIIKYLYIKEKLSPLERQLFYKKIVLKENYSNKEYAIQLGITYNDFLQLARGLKEKVKLCFSDISKLREYRENMINEYKANIFSLIEEEKNEFNYERIEDKFKDMNFCFFLMQVSEEFEQLSSNDKMLLHRYFVSALEPVLSFEELEKQVKSFLARRSKNYSFSLKDSSKILVTKILKKYYYEMDSSIVNSLLCYFDIKERDLLSEMELNRVYHILASVFDKFDDMKIYTKVKISDKK